jgi:hypothetical protein
MLELAVVIIIVGVAFFYVGRQLLAQLKGRGCSDCTQRNRCTETLLQIKPFSEKKL